MKETVVTLACALTARLAMAVDTILAVRRSFSFMVVSVRNRARKRIPVQGKTLDFKSVASAISPHRAS